MALVYILMKKDLERVGKLLSEREKKKKRFRKLMDKELEKVEELYDHLANKNGLVSYLLKGMMMSYSGLISTHEHLFMRSVNHEKYAFISKDGSVIEHSEELYKHLMEMNLKLYLTIKKIRIFREGMIERDRSKTKRKEIETALQEYVEEAVDKSLKDFDKEDANNDISINGIKNFKKELIKESKAIINRNFTIINSNCAD